MNDATTPTPSVDATSVRFRAGETLSEAIDRVVGRQFAIALAIAETPADEQPLAVHETRKAIKRLRAMLRLVRDTISADTYGTDNALLKLVAAELAAVRDSWVMAQLLDRLLPHDAANADAADELVARLQERYAIESAALLENTAHVASILQQLEHVRARSGRWSVLAGEQSTPVPHEFASIAPGLQRVYKRGRRGMRIVADSPTDTLLHVWRKRAKYLRHQVEALNVLDPENLARLEAELEELTDLLGDDHDLAVLLTRLRDDPTLVADINLDGVVAAIRHKRRELQTAAVTLGQRFFEQPSTTFLAYVESVWGDGAMF